MLESGELMKLLVIYKVEDKDGKVRVGVIMIFYGEIEILVFMFVGI